MGEERYKPVGVDGEVTITPGKTWTKNGKPKPRASVTFHEMWENYERTDNKLPYDQQVFSPTGYRLYSTAGEIDYAWDPALNKDSAHDRAVMAESGGLIVRETLKLAKFHAASNNPGAVDK